jgi:hypothetical protein
MKKRRHLRDRLWYQLRDQLGDRLGGQLWGQLWDQLQVPFLGQLMNQLYKGIKSYE